MAEYPHDLQHFIGNPDEFPILQHGDFYNHAGVSPLPTRAGQALRRFADVYETRAYLDSGFYREIEALRAAAARLMNAGKDEIAFVKNTSEGIATVAAGIDWRPGDRIVTTAVEYPANMYPWMDVAKRHDVELITVPETTADDGSHRVELDALLTAASHPKTRLLALSHVQYATGQRHDLAAIGQFCRGRDILLSVDAIQSLGVLPVDVQAMNIDFLSADGHKWLLGPEGAGVFYCRRELLPTMRPLIMGWMNVVNDQDYSNYDFRLKPDARRFEGGTHNVPGLLALKASVDLLLSLGIDSVTTRLKSLTDRLIEGLRTKDYQVASPRGDGEWSGIVSFASPRHDHGDLWRRLRTEHRTELAVRGGRLRASPHFYNTHEQMDRLIANLPGN